MEFFGGGASQVFDRGSVQDEALEEIYRRIGFGETILLSELGSHLEWAKRFKMVLGPLKEFLEDKPDNFLVFLDKAWQVARIGPDRPPASQPTSRTLFSASFSSASSSTISSAASSTSCSSTTSTSISITSHETILASFFEPVFSCIVCLELPGVAVTASCCGAVCCVKCSQKLTTCPQCRRTLLAVQPNLPAQWMANLPVSRAVGALPAQCGLCSTNLTRDRLEAHKAVCPASMIKCAYAACSQVFRRDFATEHAKVCRHREIACPNIGCDFKENYDRLTQHTQKCPKQVVQCGGCNRSFTMEKLPKHAAQCNRAHRKCPTCQRYFTPHMFAEHQCVTLPKTNTHLLASRPYEDDDYHDYFHDDDILVNRTGRQRRR